MITTSVSLSHFKKILLNLELAEVQTGQIFDRTLFLTLFFPVSPFDPPESIRKPRFSNVFRGIKWKHWEGQG